MHAEGAGNALIHIMAEGATWSVKENAAAIVLSLSSVNSYRRRLGRKQQLLERLVELACNGPASTKQDALAAVLCLAGERENISRLVEAGVAKMAVEMLDSEETGETAAAIVAAVSKRGGAEAISAVPGAIAKLVSLMRSGTERARESAAAALVLLCRRIGGPTVQKVAGVAGVEWVIWELMGTGTDRARRKAASLGRIYRKWAIASAMAAGGTGQTPALSAVSMSESSMVA